MFKASTDKADIFFDGKCLVRIHIHKYAELEKEDLIQINEAKFSLVKEKKYTVLFIPGTYSSISEEARKVSAGPEQNRNAYAKAILVSTIHHRLISNFFIKFHRPPVPTLVFDDEAKALEWLDKMSHSAENP